MIFFRFICDNFWDFFWFSQQLLCISQHNSNISLDIQERGGKQLGHVLGTTQPGAQKIEHCGRDKCFPCNTGQIGVCRRTGVGYKIVCILCEAQITSEYAGESGRNLFNRGEEYVADVRKKSADKPLWKSMKERWMLKCSNISEWSSQESSPAPREEKQMKE